ncbi:mediator of DNA damage checkpoint protein 1 isoform X3 [Hippocampus comes]|uniref:mediator of DNA damage checkpoint protein 1 isoform X3 n=1 Tax=Hippocampus comes TaxID=109280 RepID=UPI00094EFF36|nr:PREDICTED: mediator of DNA damage checkpoint protein 1 isoform X3 [Hippocampus comes]
MDATQAVNDSLFESDEEEKEEKPNKARQPLAKLCILKNDHVPEREFPLFMGDNVLGRDVSTCTLPLLAPSVSKQHAAIRISLHQRRGSRSGVEIEAVVRDLGSMNGTRIGRIKLIPNIPYPLSEGNRLFMADMPCQYLGIGDAHQNIGGQPSGVGISLARDSVEKRDGLKEMSQAWAKVSPLGKAEKKPAKNSCVSFEATPVQLQRTLVPESESDSDGERPRNRESRRKLQGSDSSPTCSTFLSPTNKIVPESPDCADGTPITSSSSTRETSHGHVSFSKEESDVDAGGQQKKDTLAFVDDSDEEQAGAAENGPTPGTAHSVLEQLKTPASFTEEELPQLSTSTESPHAISKFNMDSDTDVEEDAGEPKAVPDQRSDVDCFRMDSDTDVDDDDTGAPTAPPAQPEEGEGHLDAKAEGKKGDAAPPLLPDDFQLDSDTDVDEEADDNSGDTAPSGLALFGDVSEPEDDQALLGLNTQANVSDSAAGSHNSNAVQDPPRSSPVATAPSSATPGIAAAAAQSESDKDTDVDESSAPPAERDSDTDAEEEKNAITLPRTEGLQFPEVQNCSTPVQLSEGDVEQMATQAFLPPSLDPFERVFNGAGRAAASNGQEEEEDFAVAETQSFILQPQGQIRSCDDGANRASGCESSGEDTDELASGAVSFQLGLSDSSHLQSAAQALAMESTQAFDSDPQAYTKPPNADTTASLGNDFNIEATQAYEACEAPDSSPAMPAGSPKVNLAFQETQAYISEPCSESEEEPKEDTETQPPFDLPTSSSLALAETKLVVACQEEERPREAEGASAEQPQLEEATQLFTDVDIMEKQPTAASQTEDSHGEDPIGVLSETNVQLDEVAQPIESSSALAVNCQLMSIAATQPMATSEFEESDDEDPIPVWAQGKVQLDKERKADMSSSALPANHQPWGLAATQPMAATEIEESDDEDSSPGLAEGNIQLDEEMKPKGSSCGLPANHQPCRITSSKRAETVSKNSTEVSHESKMQSNNEEQPSTSSNVLAVATQPVTTNEQSGDEDSIAVLHERKIQLDKDPQRHTNSCSLAGNHLSMSIAPTQPMTPSENEETDVEDSVEVLHVSKVRLNKETQATTSSCAVTTPPVSIAATQPLATSEESDEDEDSIPVLRGKRKARPLQIIEDTQSLSSTLEIPSDSWNEKSPSKNGAEVPGSSNEPPSVTPIQPEDEETQTNFDTFPNNDEDELGPGQEEKAKVSSAGTPPMDTCKEEEADSEIFIPGSRKRKAKPLQIEDETQSLVSSQGEDERCEIPNSAPSAVDCQPRSANEPSPRAQQSQSEVGTSVTVKHSKGTRSQLREKEEPGEKRQTRSKMGKPGPAGSALEEEATRRQSDPLGVRGGKPERRQGPNARRGKKEGEETEAAEDRQRHERLETETKEQPRRDQADKAPQHNQEGKPEATPRARRGTRRTVAALPVAAADQDDVPAKRTRLRSNSVSSEVSTSSAQGNRGRGQDSHGPPAMGTLSRSSSSNSLASDMSCSSLGSQRGRGGRQRGSGRKTEPGPSPIPPISSQSPAPTPRSRGQRGKKADVSPTALYDENDKGKPGSKQAPVTRGRRRATVKEPSNACEGNNSAGESRLPQRNIRGRAQRTVKGEAFEVLVTPSGSNEAEAKDVVEGRKRVMKTEAQDEKPAPVQAKRRAKASCAQGGRNARDSTPDVATEHGNATSVRGSGEGAQGNPFVKSSPVTTSNSSASLSPSCRPRDASHSYKVLFTGVVDETGERVLARLGGSVANGTADMNCLVADKVRRTVKFMCAVAKGIPIVNIHWLDKSGKAGSLLPPDAFILSDPEQEKKFNFRLQESLRLASSQPLLQGYKIHITKSVKPEPHQMRDIISCSGATFLPKMPSSHKPHTVVISCPEDWPLCRAAVSASLPVVSAEFVLSGILQHKLDFDAHKLSAPPPPPPKPDDGRRRSRRLM